jgi:peptidoglycan/xylan/chitin deacetylase (PgdA/CDA1 family)
MRNVFTEWLDRLDQQMARTYLAARSSRPSLLIWTFHVLFEGDTEINRDLLFPHEGLRVSQFEQLIRYFQKQGYQFVNSAPLLDGLDPREHYVMLSFDDGYANNLRALPVLEACRVPAVFNIATGYVARNRSFWWDAHYRERKKVGWPYARILAEQNELKAFSYEEVEALLLKRYGPAALEPQSDSDRPFLPEELQNFARSPWVELANHTHDHAILPHYPEDEIRHQIRQSQQYLKELTGSSPHTLAYPNGNYDERVIRIAREEGLRLGLSGERQKHFLHRPFSPMRLGRVTLYGHRNIEGQAATYQADFSLKWARRGGGGKV